MGVAEKDKEGKPRRKPGRVPTSCAECRRLKLRCDRNVPCEKCVSRGCGAICPEGSLTAGKGNRLVLANTEQLHDRIEHLCARIRELEQALRTLQQTVSDEPHPLLRTDLLQLKAPQVGVPAQASTSSSISPSSSSNIHSTSGVDFEQHGKSEDENFIDSFGTLTLGPHGESSFLGKTARSEYLIRALSKPPRTNCLILPRVSSRIVKSFCDGDVTIPCDNALGSEVFGLLPPLSEAIRLCEVYLEHGKTFYCSVPRHELIDEILSSIYRADSFDNVSSHHSLSLLFIVFALGTLFDLDRPAYSVDAQEYYYLSRAAFSLSPGSQDASLVTVDALVHMVHYKEYSDWEAVGSNLAWSFIGLAVKSAFSIGLHLNSNRWRLPEETSQRRSRVFWSLYWLDTSMSFHLGRPPSISAAYVDCPLPRDPEESTNAEDFSFHTFTWKYTSLMNVVMSTAFGSKPPCYSVVLDLDRRIRDLHVPVNLRWDCINVESVPSGLCTQRWSILSTKELTLLNLHRAYFAQALHDQPNDLTSHRYFPSVMATYRSAWRLIRVMSSFYKRLPALTSRLGVVWSHGLSASIVMCILVTRSPASKMTKSCLEELDAVSSVFEEAAPNCRSAANIVDAILSLRKKAHDAVDGASTHDHLFSPAELDRLGGGTHLISQVGGGDKTSKSTPISSSSSPVAPFTPSPPPPPMQQPRIASPSSPLSMHPTIAEDVRNFSTVGLGSSYFDFPSSSDTATTTDVSMMDPVESFFGGFGYQHQPGLHPPPPTMGGGFSAPAPMLDATWQSFVEQLGF